MAKRKIDLDKLRVQLRTLRKDDLLDLLDRAVELVPGTRLPALLDGYISLAELAPDGATVSDLLVTVGLFNEASLRGDYYDSFNVNSKNFMRKSSGTQTWLAECERLFERCAALAGSGQHAVVRQSFDILFDLLRHVDEAHDDVVFFADEGGSWQVCVDWDTVLPAYFSCLSATSEPDEYARVATALVEDFVRYDRDKYLREARTLGTPAQQRMLP